MLCVGCNLACFSEKKRIKRRWGGKIEEGGKKGEKKSWKEFRNDALALLGHAPFGGGTGVAELAPLPGVPSTAWLSPGTLPSRSLRPCEHESFPPRLVGPESFAQGRGAESCSPMPSPLTLILLKTKKHPT